MNFNISSIIENTLVQNDEIGRDPNSGSAIGLKAHSQHEWLAEPKLRFAQRFGACRQEKKQLKAIQSSFKTVQRMPCAVAQEDPNLRPL